MTETTTTAATRIVDGHVLPAAGRWEVDPGHTDVAFTGRHLMLAKVRGRFPDVRGIVTVADDFELSSVDVTVGMASVDSGIGIRDEHLRSAELFDVENHPEATFRSTGVAWRGTRGTVSGDLTIHGISRPVDLAVELAGCVRDPWGDDRAAFSAVTEIDRQDFGITWNAALEAGGLLVSNEITITIEIETILRS